MNSNTSNQERIKGTEKASPLHILQTSQVKQKHQNILERKTCFLFQSQAEAHVSVNSFHNPAELNIKGIELGYQS